MQGADAHNAQLLNRQIEISEWTYNDRMETLFIFQILFISLMIVAILMYLRGLGALGGGFVGYAVFLLLVVVIIIITNRAMYTTRIRDKRAWSKRKFEQDNSIASPVKQGDPAYQAYIDELRVKYGRTPPPDACAACPARR
jgi:hypothetical protein